MKFEADGGAGKDKLITESAARLFACMYLTNGMWCVEISKLNFDPPSPRYENNYMFLRESTHAHITYSTKSAECSTILFSFNSKAGM